MRRAVLALVLLSSAALACNRDGGAPASPRPQAQRGAAAPEEPGVCAHGVQADLCTRCSPELAEVFKAKGDWCAEHGVPESQCLACNPGLRASAPARPPAEPWCGEHGVPEAKCTKCKPRLIAEFIAAGDYCREHGFPESVCPVCHPERVEAAGHARPAYPPEGTVVRLSSPEKVRQAGIETAVVAERPVSQSLEVVGEIGFDRRRHARLSARSEALIVEVRVDVGDEVRRGQPLVVLASGGVGEQQSRQAAAKARLEAARAALEREQGLVESGLGTPRGVQAARAEVATAASELEAASAAIGAAGGRAQGAGGRYALTAPFDGTVVAREAVAGTSAAPDAILIEVVDLSRVWAILEVPESDAPRIQAGQAVSVRLEGAAGDAMEGVIGNVAAAVDRATRTVEARVELPNPRRDLRAGQFVRARIAVGGERHGLLVPRDAVQRAEGRSIVFLQTGPAEFKPVAVELGARVGAEVEVLAGVPAGAAVATTGGFLLKSELLKDSMGAGCGDH